MALTKVTTSGFADGTDGQIITYDASGNPTTVGPGTDGQVLTSTGAGSPPAFEDAGSSVGGATGVDFNDTVKARWGTSGDGLEIHHTSDNSYIKDNGTGDLYIEGDNYLVFRNAAGTENKAKFITNNAVELYYDNVKKFETLSGGVQAYGNVLVNGGHIYLGDNQKLNVGASDDLLIYHSGGENFIRGNASASDLYIDCCSSLHIRHLDTDGGNSEYMIKGVADGAVELYHDNTKTFETTANGVKVVASEGNYAYLYVYSDEGDDNADKWRWEVGNGGAHILSNYASGSWEKSIECNGDGNVELYHDGTKKFETTTLGATVTGKLGVGTTSPQRTLHLSSNNTVFALTDTAASTDEKTKYILSDAGILAFGKLNDAYDTAVEHLRITNDGKVRVPNSGKFVAGDGDDLQIYHTGSHSYIKDAGDGELRITSDSNIWIEHGAENMIVCNGDGGVELYYDNVKRLETTAAGVTIPNTLTVSDGANFDGDVKFEGDSGATNSLVWDKSDTALKGLNDSKIKLGNDGDLQIYANGSNSVITHNGDGNLIVEATGSGEDLYLQAADIVYIKTNSETSIRCVPDGAVELYYNGTKTCQTNDQGIQVIGPEGGTGQLQIYADEGDDAQDKWLIEATTGGELHFQSLASGSWEDCLHLIGNGGAELYYDDVKRFWTTNNGVEFDGYLTGNDGDTIQLGNAGDLRIYHDNSGFNAIRSETGFPINIIKGTTENIAKFIPDGAVELYYDNVKKFETTSAGVKADNICKAWCNYDGRDNSIRASFNVSSVDDNGTGDYSFNWTVSMSADFGFVGTAGEWLKSGTDRRVLSYRHGSDTNDYGNTTYLKVRTFGLNTNQTADSKVVTIAAYST